MSLSNTQSSGKVYFLKPVDSVKNGTAREKIKPYFSVTQRNEEGKYVETTRATSVCGALTGLRVSESSYQGTPYSRIAISLSDKGENYVLDLRHNISTRSLFNSLFSFQNKGALSVEIYRNKAGYTSYALKENGEALHWKHKLEDLPKVEEKTIGRKKFVDTTALEQFFENGLNELNRKFFPNNRNTESPKNPFPKPAAPTVSKKALNDAEGAASVEANLDEDAGEPSGLPF